MSLTIVFEKKIEIGQGDEKRTSSRSVRFEDAKDMQIGTLVSTAIDYIFYDLNRVQYSGKP